MRIDGIKRIAQTYEAQSQSIAKMSKIAKKDEVELSQEAKDIQQAYRMAKTIPDIRTERVEEIKQQIKSGTYNISAQEISEKIISQLDLRG